MSESFHWNASRTSYFPNKIKNLLIPGQSVALQSRPGVVVVDGRKVVVW